MVPEAWLKTKLGDLGRIKSGATPLRSEGDRYFSDSGHPWVKTMDLNNGEVISTTECITDAALKETSCSMFPKGTVLVAMYGGFNQIGRTGLLTKPSAINQAISAIQLDQDKAHSQYVLAFLNGYVSKWKRFAASSRKDPNITRDDVVGFPILLPPLPEQKKIAQILSTWDQAITATERLLEKSQQRKKGLMQELLTGKKRLPGFEGEWQTFLLGHVFEKVSNGVTYDATNTEGLPVTRIETISTGKVNFNKVGWAPDTENTRRFILKRGDILYSHINSLEHIGRVAYFNDEEPLYHGMNLLLLRINKGYCSKFFFHLLNSPIGKKYSKTYAKSAVNQASISTTDIKTFKVNVPPLEEQQAIANTLSKADQEITALERKICSLKIEKKALMQQLLTGKRRVQVETA